MPSTLIPPERPVAHIMNATRPASNRLPVYALFAANAVSMTGNVLAHLAIPWFVLETTGSAARTGLAGAFALVPTVLAAFLGGGLVDRISRKQLSVVADVLSGLSVAAIPLLYQTIGLAFWQLLALVFIGALLDAPGITARTALFPDLVNQARMPLERANAAYQAIQRLSQLLGPPLAGILIAVVGTSHVLWFNAGSFAVSALLVAFAIPVAPLVRQVENSRGYVAEIEEGLRFLLRDRLLRLLAWTISMTNLLDAGLAAVVIPVFVRRTYGEDASVELGLVFGAFGAGAFAGSVAFAAFGHRLPRRPTYVISFVFVAASLWIYPMSPPLSLLLLARLVAGVAAGPINPILMTVFQERVPTVLRGRVFGSLSAGVLAGSPLGVVAAGVSIEQISLAATLVVIAVLYLISTLAAALNPAMRLMDHRQGQSRGERTAPEASS